MMNKKFKVSIALLFVLLILTGCNKEVNNDINKDDIVTTIDDNELSEEEIIWNDAIDDEIYNQRITIYDSVNKSLPDSQFSNDISKLNELKNSNAFAKEFLDLLDKTNIVDIINNGNDLEKCLLLSYLCIETNHHEGFGYSLNWLNDTKIVDSYNQLINVYYREQSYDSDNNLKSENNNSKYPFFIFEFSNSNTDNNFFVLTEGYMNDYSSSIDIDTRYNEVKNGKYGGVEVNWIKVDEQTLSNVINQTSSMTLFLYLGIER